MPTYFDHLHEPAIDFARYDIPLLDQCLTIGEALDVILEKGVGEKIIYFYVVDEDRRLLGVIPTRRLLTTPRDKRLVDVMIPRVITLPDTATVYDACEYFVLHRLLAFPIVDDRKRILGIVDVSLFTDEILEMEGSREDRDTLFETIGFRISEVQAASPFRVFRHRFPWLLATIASGSIAALIAGRFETTLTETILLAFFLTLILGLGESVGTQSMTITLRMLSSREPTFGWYFDKLRREIVSAALLGAGASVLVMLVAILWKGPSPAVLSIGLSILLVILNAAIIGLSVPSVVHALRRDPHIAAGPITLAVVDVATLAVYFGMASVLL